MKLFAKIIFGTVLLQSYAFIGARTFYVPLLREKGEMHVSLVGSSVFGAEGQFDWAITDKTFIMSDISFMKLQNYTNEAASFGIRRYKPFKEHRVFSFYREMTLGSYGNQAKFLDSPFFYSLCWNECWPIW